MKTFCHARTCLFCLVALLGLGQPAAAEWKADIVDAPWSPSRFVAVDKQAQSFCVLTHKSPLHVDATLPCATGQELGDKVKEGDLKTPEGVYFITKRKSAGLNYDLYGDLAFVLNFPNPIDVLRHKSGHGIWIHGRGHAITPYETQGCVALNTQDIHQLDQRLAENMPVIIADDIEIGGEKNKAMETEGREVVADTKAWAKAWEDKSPTFFDFHDPEKFSIAQGQPFSAFRNHKERLFKALPWIQVRLFDIRAIPGPDYWVTYFIQVYRSPSLISQGIKRLYWQRGADGRFRIVGMEYDEMPVTLADKHGIKPNKALVAEELEPNTRQPEEKSEEEFPVRQLVDAQQPMLEKMAKKAFDLLTLRHQPTKEDEAILEVAQSAARPNGVIPKIPPAPPAAKAPAQVATAAPATSPAPATTPAPAPAAPKTPAQATPAPSDPVARVKAAVETWRDAWEKGRLDAYAACYAANARQGKLHGRAAIKAQKARLWAGKAPSRVTLTELRVTKAKQGFTVEARQLYEGRDGKHDLGQKTLLLLPDKQGFRIAAEDWSPVATASEAAPATPAPVAEQAATPAPPASPARAPAAPPQPAASAADAAQARALIETWRSAWEQARLDAFLDCYAAGSASQGRHGKASLRAQKERLWRTKPPKRVTLSDIVLTPTTDGLTATFAQTYEGSDHIVRRGRKTLFLTRTPDGWRISREKWSRH